MRSGKGAEVAPTPSDCPIFHFFLAEAWDIRPLLASRVRMNEGTETATGEEMTSERKRDLATAGIIRVVSLLNAQAATLFTI